MRNNKAKMMVSGVLLTIGILVPTDCIRADELQSVVLRQNMVMMETEQETTETEHKNPEEGEADSEEGVQDPGKEQPSDELKEEYKITYYLNGGENHPSNPTSYSTGVSVKLGDAFRVGYTFKGWYNDAGFKLRISSIKASRLGNISLYAKWEPIKYYVYFNGNKATTGSVGRIPCWYDKTFRLYTNRFKRKGYVFTGWNTQKNGTGLALGNKAFFQNLTDKPRKKITLYAQWQKITVEKVSSIKLKSKKKQIGILFQKISDAKGYELMWSTNKKMRGAKIKKLKSNSYLMKGKEGETYFFMVRAYKIDPVNEFVYGKWSTKAKIKIPKKKKVDTDNKDKK